jgi:hypothetical protein
VELRRFFEDYKAIENKTATADEFHAVGGVLRVAPRSLSTRRYGDELRAGKRA